MSIFSKDELEEMDGKNSKPNINEMYLNDKRVQGIEKALSDIKGDQDTHDMLLKLFEEKKGFLLDLSGIGYYEGPESQKVYRNITACPSSLGKPFLLVFRNDSSSNRIYFGKIDSGFTAYESQDGRGLERRYMADGMPKGEAFAYSLLTGLAYKEKSAQNIQEFENTRYWGTHSDDGRTFWRWPTVVPNADSIEENIGTSSYPKYHGFSPLIGQDIIDSYKSAVKGAVEDWKLMEEGKSPNFKRFSTFDRSMKNQFNIGLSYFNSEQFCLEDYM